MRRSIARIANPIATFSIITSCIYLFLAFLPLHVSISTGLDPSWSYGITRAAQTGMQFGKDIIFTFGPWGFLSHGSSIEGAWWQIWLFRMIAHILLWIFFTRLVLVANRCAILYKFLAIFAMGLVYCRGISHDYEFAYTLLAVVTLLLRSNISSFWIFIFGSLTGFLSLTKLSLGIQTSILFLPLLYPKFPNNDQQKATSITDFLPSINSVLLFISAFILTSELLVYPTEIIQKSIDFFLLIPTGFLVTLIVATFGRTSKNRGTKYIRGLAFFKAIEELIKEKKIEKSRNKIFSPTWHNILIGSLAVSIALHSLLDRDVYRYLHTALEITSGYSSAMSIIGPMPELVLGLICLGSIIFYCLGKARLHLQTPRLAVYFLSIILFCWFSFKHGFVRQDAHALLFFNTSLIVACIILLARYFLSNATFNALSQKRSIWEILMLWIAIFLSVIYLIAPNLVGREVGQLSLPPLLPNSVIRRVRYTSNPYGNYLISQELSQSNLEKADLGDSVRDIVGFESVDIIPWDIVRAEKNNLNWRPRPVFQSYSAYTDFLDIKNLESFQSNPRKYLIYDFKTIDKRHPFFDEPRTLRYILCNYNRVSLPEKSNSPLLLNKLSSGSRCVADKPLISQSVDWNVPISVDRIDSGFTTLEVKVSYTLLGKIYKLLFRAPPTYIKVQYDDDSISRYRFIPENAEGGLVINPLPPSRKMLDLTFFGAGSYTDDGSKVRTVEFYNSSSLLYKKLLVLGFNHHSLGKADSP